MVQIPDNSTPECQECIPSEQQEKEHGLVHHVQVEHYQNTFLNGLSDYDWLSWVPSPLNNSRFQLLNSQACPWLIS